MLYKQNPREMKVGCFLELKSQRLHLCWLKGLSHVLGNLLYCLAVWFPSPLHYCTCSSFLLFSVSMLHALSSIVSPTLFSSLTPSVFYYPHPSFFFPLLPYLCLFNSVTVNHMSNPDTFFSLRPCSGAILADSAPQLHNARREAGRQASKRTNAPLKRRWLY